MINKWKKLSSKFVYQNPYFKVREDKVVRPTGEEDTYWVIESPRSVMVVPITAKNEVYLVAQKRYTTNLFSWEIPGGGTEGESPIKAAKRELKEETGLVTKKWKDLGISQVMNDSSNKIHHFLLAQDVKQTNNHKQEEEGIIEMKKVKFSKALEMIKNGDIIDGESIIGITLAGLNLDLIKT
jgi:8-oxo-dGTP pyrophosphatase MutT (NUDIX family)